MPYMSNLLKIVLCNAAVLLGLRTRSAQAKRFALETSKVRHRTVTFPLFVESAIVRWTIECLFYWLMRVRVTYRNTLVLLCRTVRIGRILVYLLCTLRTLLRSPVALAHFATARTGDALRT
ncbi:hypothetical protein BD413DRAFT_115561 [Trametes elegans]|nr:hypothetical protein BD413DRAFT_115561 [Trametes elegans]